MIRPVTRRREAGVILINVLVVLGLAAAVVQAMLTLADLAIARSQAFSDAGEGLALVEGAEQFAIAALRRDLAEAPETDNATEGWKRLEQDPVEIPGGAIEIRIEDARGLLNLNAVVDSEAWGEETLLAIGEAADLDPQVAARLLPALENGGPLRRMEDLTRRAGLTPAEVARLGAFAAALPGKGEVNVNAAPTDLLALLIGSPTQARILADKRAGAGLLTPEDFETAQITLPEGMGYRSDLFRLRTVVRIGATVQSFESLLQRRLQGEIPEVRVIARRNATADAPPPPGEPP